MDQINAMKAAWFTVYSTFRKKDKPQANQIQASNRGQRPAIAPTAGTSPYPTAGRAANGPAGQRYPMQPKVYHGTEIQNEDDHDDEWDQVNY